MSDLNDAILSALAELRAGQVRIESGLQRVEEALQHRSPLSQEDRCKVDALLPYLPDGPFTTRDLRKASVATENLDLAAVLDSIGNQHSLGRFLGRCADAGIGVRRISEKPPALWQRIF